MSDHEIHIKDLLGMTDEEIAAVLEKDDARTRVCKALGLVSVDTARAMADEAAEAAVAAALRKAHDAIADYPRVAPDGVEAQHYDEQIGYSQSIILTMIPDAGAALDRYVKERSDEALEAQRERDAKVADSYNEDPYPQTEYDRGWARAAQVIAAAIRHGSAISALGPSDLKNNRGKT